VIRAGFPCGQLKKRSIPVTCNHETHRVYLLKHRQPLYLSHTEFCHEIASSPLLAYDAQLPSEPPRWGPCRHALPGSFASHNSTGMSPGMRIHYGGGPLLVSF
jgi:hypothetical protein